MTEQLGQSRWSQAHAIVDALLDVPSEHREAYIATRCAGDTLLEDAVRRWLDGISHAEDDPPSVIGGYHHAPVDPHTTVPERIGRYRIVRVAGVGGMGTVYEGERDDGTFRQRVAIKSMLPMMASRDEFVQRFHNERQILASLSHPNIARLLDGDVTADGVPYCVLEYVEGEPLVAWCDKRRLGLRERLQLLRQVCDAVVHAHNRLVVHRDIKPSNVLVTNDGVVKLLDFGLARLLDDDTDRAANTRPGGFPAAMTPEYASPEQFRGEPLGVATDVFSLGVMLCELLTGHRPFAPASGWVALQHVVTSTDAPLASATPIDDSAAASRSISGASLQRALRGDLDSVIARALARDQKDRYRSVDELDAELARFLSGRPVLAREGGRWYRMRKFIGRNQWPVFAASVATVTLAAFLVSAERQSIRLAEAAAQTRLERNAALDLSRVLLGFLEVSWPYDSGGATRALKPLLDTASARLLDSQANLGARYPSLLQSLSSGYLGLGNYSAALAVERRVLALLESQPTSRDSLGIARMKLAELLRLSGHYEEGLTMSAQAIKDLSPRDPVHVTRLHMVRARTLRRLRRPAEAAAELDTAMAFLLRDSARTQLTQASVWEVRAELARDGGDISEADRRFRHSLSLRIAASAPALEIGNGYGDLAKIALSRGDVDGADTLVTRAISIKSGAVGRAHPEVADEVATLAVVMIRRQRKREAMALLMEARDVYRTARRETRVEGVTKLIDSLQRSQTQKP